MDSHSLLLRSGLLPMTGPLSTERVQSDAGTLAGAIDLGADGEVSLSGIVRRDPDNRMYDSGMFGVPGEHPGATVTANGEHNAFPSLALMPDGTLVCLYRRGSNHISVDGRTCYKKSTDGGRTWGAETVAIDSATHNVNHCSLRILSDGTWIVPYFLYDTAGLSVVSLHVARSTDGGATFTTHNTPSVWNGTTQGAGVDGVTELPNGDLLLPAYGLRDPGDTFQSSLLLKSTDGGVTWTLLSTIQRSATRGAAEPCITRRADGTLVCLIRAMGAGFGGVPEDLGQIDIKFSTDDGATWGALAVAFAGKGAPEVQTASDGTLIVCYRALRTGGPLAIRSSADGGATWSSESTLTSRFSTMSVYGHVLERAPGVFWLVWGAQTDDVANIHLAYLMRTAGRAPDGMEAFHSVTAETIRVVGSRPAIFGNGDDLQLTGTDAQAVFIAAGAERPSNTPARLYAMGRTVTNGLELGSVWFGSRETTNLAAGMVALCGTDPSHASLRFDTRGSGGYGPRLLLPSGGGAVFGSGTANAGASKGVSIDQGTANDFALALLSTGSLSHPFTTLASAATLTRLQKLHGTGGGLSMFSFASSASTWPVAAVFGGAYGGASADTTKATTSRALIEIYGALSSGGTVGDVQAGGNILAIRSREAGADATSVLFYKGGHSWQAGAGSYAGDSAGIAGTVTFTGVSNTAARGAGVGTVLFADGVSRNSTGSIKCLVGTQVKYIPFFDAP